VLSKILARLSVEVRPLRGETCVKSSFLWIWILNVCLRIRDAVRNALAYFLDIRRLLRSNPVQKAWLPMMAFASAPEPQSLVCQNCAGIDFPVKRLLPTPNRSRAKLATVIGHGTIGRQLRRAGTAEWLAAVHGRAKDSSNRPREGPSALRRPSPQNRARRPLVPATVPRQFRTLRDRRSRLQLLDG
jgi:hypothetical protein